VHDKLFATAGGDDDLYLTVKATPEDANVLTGMDGIERAAYIGRYGWIRVRVQDEASLSLARDLIAASYELVSAKAPRRRR
jgi:predicted DNA-binding protein (MmcQ/YjbR family)